VAPSRVSKEFFANLRKVSLNRKRGIAKICFLQKCVANLKGFGAKQLRTN
jgi:hypothetical protein